MKIDNKVLGVIGVGVVMWYVWDQKEKRKEAQRLYQNSLHQVQNLPMWRGNRPQQTQEEFEYNQKCSSYKVKRSSDGIISNMPSGCKCSDYRWGGMTGLYCPSGCEGVPCEGPFCGMTADGGGRCRDKSYNNINIIQ